MGRPREKKEFEEWYANDYDPWNYDSKYVQSRIRKSVSFICKNIKNPNSTIIEFGAFNGDVTALLLENLKNIQILCNDISDTAINRIQQKIGKNSRVDYCVCDMLNFSLKDFNKYEKPDCVLLLECIYYLKPQEQIECLNRLLSSIDGDVFISGPTTHTPNDYIHIESLASTFNKNGYALISSAILNRNYKEYSTFRRVLNKTLDAFFPKRNAELQNQVIYYFSKTSK